MGYVLKLWMSIIFHSLLWSKVLLIIRNIFDYGTDCPGKCISSLCYNRIQSEQLYYVKGSSSNGGVAVNTTVPARYTRSAMSTHFCPCFVQWSIASVRAIALAFFWQIIWSNVKSLRIALQTRFKCTNVLLLLDIHIPWHGSVFIRYKYGIRKNVVFFSPKKRQTSLSTHETRTISPKRHLASL